MAQTTLTMLTQGVPSSVLQMPTQCSEHTLGLESLSLFAQMAGGLDWKSTVEGCHRGGVGSRCLSCTST